MTITIRVRRDTAADWTAENPTLALGEPGAETDTGKLKVGTGADAWADLPYVGGGDAWGEFTAGSIASIVTRTDGALVKLAYTGAALPVVDSPPGPILLGTVATAHRPTVAVQAGAWWAGSGTFGALTVLVDDASGTVLGTAGGIWLQDASGTLTDTDDVYPLLGSVDWWIA